LANGGGKTSEIDRGIVVTALSPARDDFICKKGDGDWIDRDEGDATACDFKVITGDISVGLDACIVFAPDKCFEIWLLSCGNEIRPEPEKFGSSKDTETSTPTRELFLECFSCLDRRLDLCKLKLVGDFDGDIDSDGDADTVDNEFCEHFASSNRKSIFHEIELNVNHSGLSSWRGIKLFNIGGSDTRLVCASITTSRSFPVRSIMFRITQVSVCTLTHRGCSNTCINRKIRMV